MLAIRGAGHKVKAVVYSRFVLVLAYLFSVLYDMGRSRAVVPACMGLCPAFRPLDVVGRPC